MTTKKEIMERKAEALSNMLGCFPDTKPEILKGYLSNIDEYYPEDVELACRRFSQGLVERDNHRFCPSVPELVSEVRRIATPTTFLSDASRRVHGLAPSQPRKLPKEGDLIRIEDYRR